MPPINQISLILQDQSFGYHRIYRCFVTVYFYLAKLAKLLVVRSARDQTIGWDTIVSQSLVWLATGLGSMCMELRMLGSYQP